MSGLTLFFQEHLAIIYGVYGLAFFVTGVAVWLESGRSSQLPLSRAIPFLAAFGLLHGVHEWVEMYEFILLPGTSLAVVSPMVEMAHIAVLAASFACVMEFAVRLLGLLEPDRYGRWRWLTPISLALYLALVVAYRVWGWDGDQGLFWRVTDILSRYVIGVPGTILACWAMFVQRRAFLSEGYSQFSGDFVGAALAFAWYALFQFIVPPSPYFPSSVFNNTTFMQVTGIPVQLGRAVVVTILAFFIIRVLRVFEIEYARRIEALNQERFDAQEKSARDLSMLYETCRIMGTSLDLDVVLRETLGKIVELIEPVQAGMVFLTDPGESALLPRAAYHSADVYLPPDFAERCRTLAGGAYESREIRYDEAGESGSILAIPLFSNGDPIGALCLDHAGSFSNFAVLDTVARQLVIAIENARLYEEVQKKEVLRGQLLERVVAAQEEERKRLARELHDQTGQRLTALALGVSSAGELLDKNPEQARERLFEVEEMCTAAVDDLRQFVADLRPALLDDLGLVAALRQMAKQTEERTEMKVEFVQTGPRRRLASEIETVLYRIAQEALNNTVRHAHSRWARIELGFCNTEATLVVTDDGIGFLPGSILKQGAQIRAWGLLGMQERVELVGGRLEIESAPGRGVRLAVTIPLEVKEDRVVDPRHAG